MSETPSKYPILYLSKVDKLFLFLPAGVSGVDVFIDSGVFALYLLWEPIEGQGWKGEMIDDESIVEHG